MSKKRETIQELIKRIHSTAVQALTRPGLRRDTREDFQAIAAAALALIQLKEPDCTDRSFRAKVCALLVRVATAIFRRTNGN
jgi:hypothetical protein